MWHVTDTDNFYKSVFGQHISSVLSQEMEQFDSQWMTSANSLVRLAIGYPFCIQGLGAVSAILMPSESGALSWSDREGVRVACIDQASWPVESEFADRLFICHALEHSGDAQAFLAEAYRVLAGGGKIIMTVPHRRGLWARSERSPFGQGTPFSRRQLYRLLEKTGFEPVRCRYSLFLPPFVQPLPKSFQLRIDSVGRYLWGVLGGVLMVEAVKVVYAPTTLQAKGVTTSARPFAVARPAGVSSLDKSVDVEQK